MQKMCMKVTVAVLFKNFVRARVRTRELCLFSFILSLSLPLSYSGGATTFSIMTFSITTLDIIGLVEKLSKNDTHHKWRHNNALPLCWMSLCWVLHFIYCYAECWVFWCGIILLLSMFIVIVLYHRYMII